MFGSCFRTLEVIHVPVFGSYVFGSCFRTLAVIRVYVFRSYVFGSCFGTLAVIHDSDFCVLVICVSTCNYDITECGDHIWMGCKNPKI